MIPGAIIVVIRLYGIGRLHFLFILGCDHVIRIYRFGETRDGSGDFIGFSITMQANEEVKVQTHY